MMKTDLKDGGRFFFNMWPFTRDLLVKVFDSAPQVWCSPHSARAKTEPLVVW